MQKSILSLNQGESQAPSQIKAIKSDIKHNKRRQLPLKYRTQGFIN
jgi:hypothetical protein